MAKYKWDSPGDWLGDKINEYKDTVDEYLRTGTAGPVSNDTASAALFSLATIANSIVNGGLNCDSDMIQDAFQDEMDDDGYFVDLESECGKCVDCGAQCYSGGEGSILCPVCDKKEDEDGD